MSTDWIIICGQMDEALKQASERKLGVRSMTFAVEEDCAT